MQILKMRKIGKMQMSYNWNCKAASLLAERLKRPWQRLMLQGAGVVTVTLLCGLALNLAGSPVKAGSEGDNVSQSWNVDGWSAEELTKIRSLWIGNLPKLPADPTNKYADDPRAADFGHKLFFDTRLSSNGKIACATCHQPSLNFTDGRKVAVGLGTTARNAPTIIGAAYNHWFFWDGRKDSQWSQATASLENPLEHNMPRDKVVDVLRRSADYRERYTELFGPLPAHDDKEGITRAFTNVAKAIAAYERKLLPGPSKFDRYVKALIQRKVPAPEDRLTLDESQGLKVFIADQRGRCMQCHNGPMFTNQSFHNIGVQFRGPVSAEQGRIAGVKLLVKDEFNCASKYSDAKPEQCSELKFLRTSGRDLLGAFKAPTLRYLSKSGPYMHNGSLKTLEDVTWHYRTTPIAGVGRTELDPFVITDTEFVQLEKFLLTLDGPIAADPKYLRSPNKPPPRGY
jgi:cytochrome c peroxidase